MSQVAQEPTSFRGRHRATGAVSMFFFHGFLGGKFFLGILRDFLGEIFTE